MMHDPEKTIGNLIDKQSTAFIGSVDENGFPNVKAMLQPRKRDGIGVIWFSTNTSSMRVSQFNANNKACVYFYDKRFFRGAQLIGAMEVLTDAASKESIWRRGDTLYYKKGVTDPDYCVLRFTTQSGRYYANFSSQSFTISELISQ
ncbi:MAG: pyridoxamine 5'-phosphate oxidase family protein [Clostridiales bacterium]|jgi:general stress protein 26|nr:pyridoxamine 5'-phosphate oxidase family protein [Clostridiales bacterium]